MGRHSVACTACTPLALKWLERHAPAPAVEPAASDDASDEKPA